jgi:Arm DNA-binding domain
MARKALTDRTLKSLKPAASHYDVWDATVPGLGVRVSQTGRKTFVLMARIRRGGHPTRRALGVYGAITLADARTKAQEWLKLIRQGIDPIIEEERRRGRRTPKAGEHICRGRRGLHQGEGGHRAKGEGGSTGYSSGLHPGLGEPPHNRHHGPRGSEPHQEVQGGRQALSGVQSAWLRPASFQLGNRAARLWDRKLSL